MSGMNHLFLILLTFSTLYNSRTFGQQREKIEIFFETPSFSNKSAKIAYYYGKKIFLLDSAQLDERGEGIVSGEHHEGIYLLLLSDSPALEFMVTEALHYIVTQSVSVSGTRVTVTGNRVTEAYADFLLQKAHYKLQADSLNKSFKNLNYPDVNLVGQDLLREVQDSFDIYTNALIQKFEGSLLSAYLKSQLQVKIPQEWMEDIEGNVDSCKLVSQLNYFRDHYFDNIVWYDPRLIYTPILADKVDIYLDKLTQLNPKSLASSLDKVLSLQSDSAVFKYIIGHLIATYENRKNTGLGEYAYLHLIGNYYLTGKTPWIDSNASTAILTEFEKLKPVSLTMRCPDINLPDNKGQMHSLHELNSDYIIVIFWDHSCTACKRVLTDMANVLSIHRFQNVQVFTIYSGNDPDIWQAFIARKIPSGWINTIQSGPTDYLFMYNISRIPTIFILDKNKTIQSKNITVPEVNSFLFDASKR
jgi:hypothetical protein